MAEQVITLRFTADGKVAVSVAGEVEDALTGVGAAGQAGGKAAAAGMDTATRSTRQLGVTTTTVAATSQRSHRKIATGIESISTQLARVQKLAGAWFAGAQVLQVVPGVARMADEYQNVGARLRIASGNSASFAASQQDVLDVALRTHTALGTTADLVTKLSTSFRSLGADNLVAYNASVQLSDTVLKAVQLSGASASAADAAITQLGQGLASGTLRGDELNSILEQTPRLAQAIADGMGITVGQLRAMGEQGKITAVQIANALQAQAAAVDKEYSQLPLTIGRAWTDLRTQVQAYIGQADTANGTSNAIARGIAGIAAHIGDIARAVVTLGTIVAAVYARNLIANGVAWVASLRAQAAAAVAMGEATAVATTAAAASVNKITLGTLAARTAMKGLAVAGNALLAAFVGWNIGTWLRDQFLSVRIAAIYFVESTQKAWELLINGVAQGITHIKLWFEQVRLAVGRALSNMLSDLAVQVAAIPKIGPALADTFLGMAKAVRPATSNVAAYRAELTTLEAMHQKNMAQITKLTDDMEEYERAQSAATKGTNAAADALGKLHEQLASGNASAGASIGDGLAATVARMNAITAAHAAQAGAKFQSDTAGIAGGSLGALRALDDIYARNTADLADMRDALAGVSAAQADYNRTVAQIDAAYIAAGNTAGAYEKRLQSLAAAQQKLALSQRLANKQAADSVMQQLRPNDQFSQIDAMSAQVKSALDDVQAQMAEAAADLNNALSKGFTEGIESAVKRMAELTKETARLGMTAKQLDFMKMSAVAGLAAQGVRGLQSFSKEGSKAYAELDTAASALALTQGILAIIAQGAAPPPVSFAAMAAMAVALAPLLAQLGQSIKMAGNAGFTDTAAQRQASQGTGTVLGDTAKQSESIANAMEITARATSKLVGINTGMLRALQSLQAALSSAGTMLARGAGEADFSGFDLSVEGDRNLFEDFDILGRLFGGKTKITDQGIQIFGGALGDLLENITLGAYQEVQSKTWAFGHTHTKEATQSLSGAITTQFQLILDSIADAVSEGAKALGLNMDEVNKAIAEYQIESQKISLMGLSAEDQQKALEAVFSSIFDGLAGAVVPFIDQFQRVGEGLGETLVRVATEVQVMQQAVKYLGLTVATTDPEQYAQVADGLIQMAGGVENFITQMQSFTDAFAPDEFKFQLASDALNSAFDQLGLMLPSTRDGMWALMQSLDATTEAGREQIAALLSLTDTANQYYDTLEKRQQELAKAQVDYATLSASLRAEAGMDPLGQKILEIAQWSQQTSQKL
ncbi:MAG TPA: tape measure protein, partial [Rhodanobacteraceae bacterium]|nr:tape measure protein [Rhodanobacteraceae bacterium]